MLMWNEEVKRWYLDGKPVHAGDTIEIQGWRQWLLVRVESREAGRELDAYAKVAGLEFKRKIAGFVRERIPGGYVGEPKPWAHENVRWPTTQ